MKHRTLRYALVVCLLAAAAFAAWGWLQPYSPRPDPAARCKVVETHVSKDRSYYWLHIHLEVAENMSHDLQQPVWLETAAGARHEPADSTFGNISGREPKELWFKFWLQAKDLEGPLDLHLNGASLVVRTGNAPPDLGTRSDRNFTTDRW